MTVFHIIIVDPNEVTYKVTEDMDYAEELQYEMTDKGYSSHDYGDIDGEAYVVVYENPIYKAERGL